MGRALRSNDFTGQVSVARTTPLTDDARVTAGYIADMLHSLRRITGKRDFPGLQALLLAAEREAQLIHRGA